MERFTEEIICPKCGRVQRVEHVQWHVLSQFDGEIVREWLVVECERCGYTEDRAPLDKEPGERKG